MPSIFTQSISFIATKQYQSAIIPFLTCLRYIFNSSVIPEMMSSTASMTSDDFILSSSLQPPTLADVVLKVMMDAAYSMNDSFADVQRTCQSFYQLLRASDTTQFASTLIIPISYAYPTDAFFNDIVRYQLKNMRYFSSTLQKCIFSDAVEDPNVLREIFQIRSLTSLDIFAVDVNDLLLALSSYPKMQLEYLFIGGLHDRFLNRHDGGSGSDNNKNDEQQQPNGYCFLMNRLRQLRVETNSFSTLEKLLKQSPNLTSLQINRCRNVDCATISELVPKLVNLELIHSGFASNSSSESIISSDFADLSSLIIDNSANLVYEMVIDFNHLLNSSSSSHFKRNLRQLKLKLCNTHYGSSFGPDLRYLADLENLSVLELTRPVSRLNDDNVGNLSRLKLLRVLRVVEADITSIAFQRFMDYPNYKSWRLSNARSSEDNKTRKKICSSSFHSSTT